MKLEGRALTRSAKDVLRVAAVSAVAVVIAASVARTSWHRALEDAYYDWWHVLAGVRYAPRHAAVVAIDDETLLALKDDPLAFWAPHFGRALEVLTQIGVKAIGLDFLYQVSAEGWLRKLQLTPPEKGSELDDGLLTASEISQLKMNADWVILSACNTAAPDGTPGAEGLSGLARAFFYAGARSLLVSHWAVSSEASVALTTRMFEEAGKGAPKAEALRRSMLALMHTPGKPHFAHPAFWAPFVVVGEGNAGWGSAPVSALPAQAPATEVRQAKTPESSVNPADQAIGGVRRIFEGLFGGSK